MTRAEYNEFRYIKSYKTKGFELSYGTQLTIPTDGTVDYKNRLNELYTSWNFHPAAVRVDTHYFDDKERIVYIYGRTWEMNGEQHDWTELYTAEEKASFRAALQ